MKSFKVSNFRLFGNEGAEIVFKPLTILTGANSSGKSSYVKALFLFGEYLEGLLNDYRRDGAFDPIKHELDFSNPLFQLGGYTNTVNRSAQGDSPMSFTYEVFPKVSCFGEYKVTYAFDSDQEFGTLDHGFLKEISISRQGDMILRAFRTENRSLKAETVNNNNVLHDFIAFCRYCLLPDYVKESGKDPDTDEWFEEFCDDNSQFSPTKATATKIGSRLAKLQGEKVAIFDYSDKVRALPENLIDEYKHLFKCNMLDLFEALEKLSETNLVFYFPVLSLFVDKSKKEAISILREKAHMGESLSVISSKERFTKDIEDIVSDFENSDFDSFIDYYRNLENFVLENVNSNAMTIGRWGKSFSFIEDHIIQRIDVSYDNGGFSNRDESETMFSTVYSVLSKWQWAEDEAEDNLWKEENHGAVLNTLWGKDNSFIQRSIDFVLAPYYSSSHILYNAYKDYLRLILSDCLIPDDLSRMQYNTSSFTSVQRLHSFEEDSHFVNVIKHYLEGRAYLEKYKSENKFLPGKESRYEPDSFLNKWLNKMNICNNLEFIVPLGLGFSLVLNHDGYKEHLGDVGHGITQIISILLQIEGTLIENEILDIRRAQKQEHILPPVKIIGIEEPEVSLHPCYQSLLAEILYDALKTANGYLSLIVETHSEYLIRKLQVIASRQKDDKPQDVFAVYYFKTDGTAYDLKLNNSGRFELGFGPGFFDESASLKYDLLSNDVDHNNKPQ